MTRPPLYCPRRHRRKLLFPPGLLALACLLLLGCLRLGQDARLRPKAILKFYMPVSPSRLHKLNNLSAANSLNKPFIPPSRYLSKDSLDKFRTWNDFKIDYDEFQNYINLITIDNITTQYKQDSLKENGLRVQFASNAKYKNLINLLNILDKNNIKKYWFDIYNDIPIFYAITIKSIPNSLKTNTINRNLNNSMIGILDNDMIEFHPKKPEVSSSQRFEECVLSAFNSPWRNPILLLLLISILSGYKISAARN